jgi:tetratricopeptide (TPR) repeat protein
MQRANLLHKRGDALLSLVPNAAEADFRGLGKGAVDSSRLRNEALILLRRAASLIDFTATSPGGVCDSAERGSCSERDASGDQSKLHPLHERRKYEDLMVKIAQILQAQKNHRDALASVERALFLQPAHAEGLFAKMILLRDLSRADEAVDLRGKMMLLDPTHAAVHRARLEL